MLDQFLTLTRSKTGCGYVWGSQGELLTKEQLQKFINIHGRDKYYFSTFSAEKWLGKQCFDCSGLIVWALQELRLIPKSQDYTADGLYKSLCKPVNKKDLKVGDLCFSKNSGGYINHVGIYIGDNRVLHARGSFYGVVNTVLFDSFTTFGRLKYFENETVEEITPDKAIDILVSKKVINSPVYWKGRLADVRYLDQLFVNIVKVLK